jgi:hypothetical protein
MLRFTMALHRGEDALAGSDAPRRSPSFGALHLCLLRTSGRRASWGAPTPEHGCEEFIRAGVANGGYHLFPPVCGS